MPRLRRTDCSAPGIARRKRGKGFQYAGPDGAPLRDKATLDRIKALVIPPAWADVWICPHPYGHIQAMGTDAKGRRQYRYHDLWRLRRDREKFDHMIEFARALPRLREQVERDLALMDLSRDNVLACAVRLLDLGFFRIGGESYAEENESFGLATIRKSHVRVTDDEVVFDYEAKSGKRCLRSLADPEVLEVVRSLKRRRGGGEELLAYRRNGRWCDVKSTDINTYIKAVTDAEFSAKTFRTWNGTVLACVALAVSTGAARSPTASKRAVARTMKEVAHYLGNTPAVCRSSYVDPRAVDLYLNGQTIKAALGQLGADAAPGHLSTQGAIEHAVLDLLEQGADEMAVAA